MKKIRTKSLPHVEASQQFARQFVAEVLQKEKNFTVFFEGGLGAGKTLLIREMLRAFGVEGPVPSPTFVFVHEYEQGKKKFAHFDLYRIKESGEFFARGFNEIAEDASVCKFVEWPDRVPPEVQRQFSGTHFVLQLKHGKGAGMRSVKILKKE